MYVYAPSAVTVYCEAPSAVCAMSSRYRPSTYSTRSSGGSLSTGAIVGIVVGSVVLLILSCACSYIRRIRRQAALQQAQAQTFAAVVHADRVEQQQRAAVARSIAHNNAAALNLHHYEPQHKQQQPAKQVQPLPYSGMEMTVPVAQPYAPTMAAAPVQPQHITIHVGAPRKQRMHSDHLCRFHVMLYCGLSVLCPLQAALTAVSP